MSTLVHPALTPSSAPDGVPAPALSRHLDLVGRCFLLVAPYASSRGRVVYIREACCQQLRACRVEAGGYGWGVWIHVQELDGATEIAAADFPEGVWPCPRW